MSSFTDLLGQLHRDEEQERLERQYEHSHVGTKIWELRWVFRGVVPLQFFGVLKHQDAKLVRRNFENVQSKLSQTFIVDRIVEICLNGDCHY